MRYSLCWAYADKKVAYSRVLITLSHLSNGQSLKWLKYVDISAQKQNYKKISFKKRLLSKHENTDLEQVVFYISK